jgi:carbon-monoxide dehydrogenase small subunit
VQQALRDEHGVQCGFCTPGIVMTLAALTTNEQRPSSETLLAALSGHLCRCTGYQGIKRAVRSLAGEPVASSGDHG